MNLIKFGHVTAAVLLSLYGLVGLGNPSKAVAVWWLVLVVYYFLIWGVFKKNIFSIRLSMVLPLLAVGVTVPFVFYNLFMFFTDHPVYQDSPATILVVLIVGVVVTLPSLVVLFGYWRARGVWLPSSHNKTL